MSTRAIAFIATGRPAESRAFYTDIVGLRLVDEHDFAIVMDAFGTTLRIQKAGKVTPAPYTAFGLEVADIEVSVDALVAKGVVGLRYPHFEQDARGIWTAPGGARVFWFHDPDANVISLSTSP